MAFLFIKIQSEASSFDQTNMTKNWFKFHKDEPYFLNLTKIHDTDKHKLYSKKMLVWPAWTGPLASACKLALTGTPAQPRFAPLQEKKSGTEIRRTPDVKLSLLVSILVMFNY